MNMGLYFVIVFGFIVIFPYSLIMMMVHSKDAGRQKSYISWAILSSALLVGAVVFDNVSSRLEKNNSEIKQSKRATLNMTTQNIIDNFNSVAADAELPYKLPLIQNFYKTNINPQTNRLSHKITPSLLIIIDIDSQSDAPVALGVLGQGNSDPIAIVGSIISLSASIYGKKTPEIDAVVKLCGKPQPKDSKYMPEEIIGKFSVVCGISNGITGLSIYPN